MHHYCAENQSPEKGSDTFRQWFSKMNGAIKSSHWEYRLHPHISCECKYKEATKEQFYCEKIGAISEFVQKFEQERVFNNRIDICDPFYSRVCLLKAFI